jgi:hypothetical protein
LTSSGTTCVRLHIAHVDFSASPGDDTRGRGLESLSGLGGEFHLARGGGERLRAMPPTKSFLLRKFGAPIAAATFNLRTMS